MNTQINLRTTFNEDAKRYDRYRPRYPAALFDKLVKATHLSEASKVLEIGPGTGQATEPLAKVGCGITCIELGAALATKAREKLKQYPHVQIITGAFEDTDLPASQYDLIFSATAFHWIKDEFKFVKTAQLLKPEGYLAITHTEHVSDGTGDTFFTRSKPIYNKYMPPNEPVNVDKELRLPTISQLKPPDIDGRLFKLRSFDVFPMTVTYSAQEYAGLLSTYSPMIALPAEKRQGFLAEIEAFITQQFGGTLEKKFAFTLAIAQKL